MDKDEVERLSDDVIKLNIELFNTKVIVECLLSWMVNQIGKDEANDLLAEIKSKQTR